MEHNALMQAPSYMVPGVAGAQGMVNTAQAVGQATGTADQNTQLQELTRKLEALQAKLNSLFGE